MDRIKFTTLCGKYSLVLEEQIDCVVDMDGPIWSIDTEHPSYPKEQFGAFGQSDTEHVLLMGSTENINIVQRDFIKQHYGEKSKQFLQLPDKVKNSNVHLEAHPLGSPEQLAAAQAASDLDTQEGAGTELKKLLGMFGIKSTKNCSCNAKAKQMNERGIEWCKENKDTITSWLEEEAKKRNLPFSRFVARKIINFAISRAEKKKK